MSQTIPKTDQAWEDKFSGAAVTVNLGAGSVVLPVEFFQEEPDVEKFGARAFPALSIALRSIETDGPRRQGEQEGDRYKVSEDTVPAVHTSAMLPVPTPYRLIYQLETWAKKFAVIDRALQQLVLERVGDRGFLTLTASRYDGADETVHAFLDNFANSDDDLGDLRIYHKIYTYEVLVELGPQDILTVKQAMEMRFRVLKGRAPEGEALVDQPDLILDTIIVTTG